MILSLCFLLAGINMPSSPTDTLSIQELAEINITATNKENTPLRKTATSASRISKEEIERHRISSFSDLNGIVPNFFMPRYGSRLSSAIYIRGIGSRINTPAIALYVDDAPVADKSEYDTDLLNIDHIDVLRGPQGTLYGRNAMGGILRLYTRNPFQNQGTEISLGGATRNYARHISVTTRQCITPQLALTAGASFHKDNGFFRNYTLQHKADGTSSAGAHFKLLWRPAEDWNIGLSAQYEYSDEDAYPYFYSGQSDGSAPQAPVDTLSANRQGKYRRSIAATNLTISRKSSYGTFTAVTSYRNLSDRMFMDQDFINKDYFTLEERQKGNTLSEEITWKNLPGQRWEWTGGLFGLYEALRTTSPVVFYEDGMDMLNANIASHLPSISYPLNGNMISMPLSLTLTDNYMSTHSHFNAPVINGALFFQSTWHLFLWEPVSLTAGLRLDYEKHSLRYKGSSGNTAYSFSMPMIQPAQLMALADIHGKLTNHQTALLPKISLQYTLPSQKGNVYLSLSKGQRSGGYNIQMFSDVISSILQNRLMAGTRDYCSSLLQQQADKAPTESLKNMFLGIKQTVEKNIPVQTDPDVSAITYRPEYCWNYEAGTHLNLAGGKWETDFSVFFMDIRDQQLSRMTGSGLGRIMVNAGKSHSCGAELSVKGHLFRDRLQIGSNYGFTHAEFKEYNTGTIDCKGNTVPFIPQHNVSLSTDCILMKNAHGLIDQLSWGICWQGMGRIQWNEENTAHQNFYSTLNTRLSCSFAHNWTFTLWGRNITGNNYNSFWFESMGRQYYQKGNPSQWGAEIRYCF